MLGHAARADNRAGTLTVRILDAGRGPDEIALVALGRDPAREGLLHRLDDMDRLDDMSYQDLRIEMLGLVSVET